MLDFESFRFDIYQNQTQGGFITDRPLVWLKVLDAYVNTSDHITCRWENIKKKTGGQFHDVRMHTCFMANKYVNISIKLATGTVNIKGAQMKLWIENEFDVIKSMVNEFDRREIQPKELNDIPCALNLPLLMWL